MDIFYKLVGNWGVYEFMRAAQKVMPLMLLCWSTMPEMDVGGMVVESEPFH